MTWEQISLISVLFNNPTCDGGQGLGVGLEFSSQLCHQCTLSGSVMYVHLVLFVSARGYEYVLEPSPVPLPLDRPQETQVLQVSCGRAHSLVLTDSEGGDARVGTAFLLLGLKWLVHLSHIQLVKLLAFPKQVGRMVSGELCWAALANSSVFSALCGSWKTPGICKRDGAQQAALLRRPAPQPWSHQADHGCRWLFPLY